MEGARDFSGKKAKRVYFQKEKYDILAIVCDSFQISDEDDGGEISNPPSPLGGDGGNAGSNDSSSDISSAGAGMVTINF